MKVILLHNAKAGKGQQPTATQLVNELRQAGHEVFYQSTREKGAKWSLLEPADLVIAAGGDGTVRKAALAVAGRGMPLAILPLGTANNLAKTFGIDAPVQEIIHCLATARRSRLDVALASGPWGKIPFVESSGTGLLARLICSLSQAPGPSAPSIARCLQHLRSLLQNHPAQTWSATVGDQTVTGEFLLMEALNTRSAGPNLLLAPNADPGDGLLDFAFVRAEDRQEFARYLEANCRPAMPPPVEIIRGKTLQLHFEGTLHVDDFTWSAHEGSSALTRLQIHIPGPPVEILSIDKTPD